jgi:hypothetical protein
MKESPRAASPSRGVCGYHWHRDDDLGFAIAVPRRFQALGSAVDPVAKTLDVDGRAEAARPCGLWDPEIGASSLPLRTVEFAVLDEHSSERMLGGSTRAWLRLGARATVPPLLESLALPGFEPLGVTARQLGALDALAFEYTWHGFLRGKRGGDHGLLVWARTSRREHHVYCHCPEKEWRRALPELEVILATFAVL